MDKELITAYIDNEILYESLKNEIKNIIESDPEYQIEYRIQLLVKKLAYEKYNRVKAPEYLRTRILNQIMPAEEQRKTQESFLTGLFYKPAFSFATAIIIVISLVLIIFNITSDQQPPEISDKDFTPDNMFYQAENNFQAIIEGKLNPQLVAKQPDEIRNFFVQNGVRYQTIVKTFPQWSLLGAVVSEDKGEKFAHHVYTGKKGEIIYVFQVDESYLKGNKIITLNEKLLSYLDKGNCFIKTENNKVILFKKVENNIFAVVSNAALLEVQNNFCNI